jgi:hypothetical protein
MRCYRAALAGLVLGLALILGARAAPERQGAGAKEKAPPAGKEGPARYALLIGVTEYAHLDKSWWLEGGANDVLLMRDLLTEKFGFPAANVVILSEAEGKNDPRRLPTRENIRRECERLARRAHAGDQVVVHMSSHGCRPPDPKEPTGFNNFLLPRDCRWDEGAGEMAGVIRGRELGDWLAPLPAKKALLWVVVDACHSGQGVRGLGEKPRQVDVERALKVPAAAIRKAEERARTAAPNREMTRGEGEAPFRDVPLGRQPGVVLTYACLSRQQTVEGRFPHPVDGDRRPFGLLTHTLSCLLRAATEPLTYRELLQRVQNRYTADARDWPTPVIEGSFQDRAVLSGEALAGRRAGFILTPKEDKLTLNAGKLHGLTADSVLAVYPPAGEKGGALGYVRLREARLTTSVVAPTEFRGAAEPKAQDLVGGRCVVEEIAYEDLRFKVALDRAGSGPETGGQLGARLKELERALNQLAGAAGSPVRVVADADGAEWLVRLKGEEVLLLPGKAWKDTRKDAERRLLKAGTLGQEVGRQLKDRFAQLIHAEQLLKLAATPTNPDLLARSGSFPPEVKVKMARRGEKPREGPGLVGPRVYYHGDEVRFTIENPGQVDVDVTILYIDSRYGIQHLFPTTSGGEPNRVPAGKTVRVPAVEVDTETWGRENVVVLAVKSQGEETMDFVSLAKPTIEAARGEARRRGPARARGLDMPLGRLLTAALYGGGNAPRMKPKDVGAYTTQVIPVTIIKGKRPAAEE